MSHSIHFTTPFIASFLLISPAFAQTQPAPSPTSPPKNGDVSDMTNVTMTSPAASGPASGGSAPQAPLAAPAPQPPPAAVAPATPPPPAPMAQPVVLNAPIVVREPEPVHQGFYLRLVSAPAFVSFSGSGPDGNAKITGLGSASVIALGGSIARGLVLGGMLTATQVSGKFNGGPFIGARVTNAKGTFDATNKAMAATSGLALMLDWYPNPLGGWHAGMAGGLGFVAVQNLADDSQMVGTGLTGRLFGGYDFSIGKAWSLGLGLSLSGTTSAKLKDSADSSIDTGYRLKSLAVGFDASIVDF